MLYKITFNIGRYRRISQRVQCITLCNYNTMHWLLILYIRNVVYLILAYKTFQSNEYLMSTTYNLNFKPKV